MVTLKTTLRLAVHFLAQCAAGAVVVRLAAKTGCAIATEVSESRIMEGGVWEEIVAQDELS